MRPSPLFLIFGLVCSAFGQDAAPPSRPTPKAIRTYLSDCTSRGVAVDLVGKFGVDFRGLDLRGVDLKGVHRVGLETLASGIDFSSADLRGADFGGAKLEGAIFRETDIRGARFTTARLDRADFGGANIGDAHFQECWLPKANLSGADLTAANINGSFFKGAILDGARLHGVRNDLGWRGDLSGVSLRGVDLSGFNFSDTDLSGADLSNTDLTNARFQRSNLTNVDLTGAKLDGVVMDAAILNDVEGVDADTLARLREEADRAGYEATQAEERRQVSQRASAFLWGHRIVAILALLCSVYAVRCAARKQGVATLVLLANILALLAACLYLLLNHDGLNTLVGNNPALARPIGGLWILSWPVAVFGSIGMGACAIAVAVWQSVQALRQAKTRHAAVSLAIAAALAAGHAGFVLVIVFRNAPTV